MNRKLFSLSCVIFVLAFTSCKQDKTKKTDTVPAPTVKSQLGKDSSVVKEIANTPAQILAKPQVPVLCYHRIEDGKKGDYTVSLATFAAHLKILSDSGYHSILPDQLYDYLVYNKSLPQKPFLISFDDSRVEHFEIAAPMLEKYKFRAAFFIMTITYNKKNYMTKDQITQLAQRGHSVGLHSWDHTMVIKYKDSADWQKEVVIPKEKLEKIIGKKVEFWAHPNGVYNHEAAQELSKYFKISFALATKRDSLQPLQSVRRIIVPECSPQGLLKSMRSSFGKK